MDSEFPYLKKTIQQILKDSITDEKPLENETLEFKSFWEVDDSGELNRGVREETMRDVCGMLNHKGGVLLIGIDNRGRLVNVTEIKEKLKKGYKNTEDLLKSVTSHLESKLGTGIFAANIEINHELVIQGDKTQTVVRVDIKPAADVVFFRKDKHGKGKVLPVRMNDETRELDAEGAIDFERNRRRRNRLFDRQFHDSVPPDVKRELGEIEKKFEEENYQDTTTHLYRLMRNIMQKKYDKQDKYSKILVGVLGGLFNNALLIFVGSLAIAFLSATNLGLTPGDASFGFWLGWFIGILIMPAVVLTIMSGKEQHHWLINRVSPGGINIIFDRFKMHPPSSICLALFWCIVSRQKKIEIEVLVWALIWFDCFKVAGESPEQTKLRRKKERGERRFNSKHYGSGFGSVIFELSNEKERVDDSQMPLEASIAYILKNCILMVNSLYSSEENEVKETKSEEKSTKE